MEYGMVYLLTNPVMPDLVKIGMTTQEDIDKRMKELYTTGVPVPFECGVINPEPAEPAANKHRGVWNDVWGDE